MAAGIVTIKRRILTGRIAHALPLALLLPCFKGARRPIQAFPYATMSPSDDTHATPELDSAVRLPDQHRRSLVLLLLVQAVNSFNDNFVKILIVAFANAVAKGTTMGDNMQVILGAIFSLPYILFAPLAGYLSDRFSKKSVTLGVQLAQVLVFVWFGFSIWMGQTQMSLFLCIVGFFFLATQAAFFGPAKMGILKELVGSRRLGSVSGWMQLTMFVGILGGMWAGGDIFGRQLKAGAEPWGAALTLVVIVGIVALLQVVGSLFVHKTPEHPEVKFQRSVLWEHFSHLKLLYSGRPIRLASLGITYFWFMANAIGSILVTLSKETYPTDDGAASQAMSMMAATLGVGIMIGSVIAGMVCRRRIELGLVPVAGLGMSLAVLWTGLVPIGSNWIFPALILVGASSGAFMNPLYAFVQDRAKPDERARILSSINLMDCLAGFIANVGFVAVLMKFNVPARTQLLILVLPSLAAALFITKLLPQGLLRLVAGTMIRILYNLKSFYAERVPSEGAVLVLANHTSYADALVLGATCQRDLRFVMFDTLYNVKAINWFLKIFGTVPISPTKAKEAIRTVADALKQQQAVALFPEGQLTRTGLFNELQRGYELMARMGGESVVQPVWIDGLWGSIFSYEGGRFFNKVPKALPYRVSVWFGEPIPAREASPARVREAMLDLGAEAFATRKRVIAMPRFRTPGGSVIPAETARVLHFNAMRILETSLLHEGDAILCLLPPEHPVARTFTLALPAVRNMEVFTEIGGVKKRSGRRLIAVGDARTLASSGPPIWDLAINVQAAEHSVPQPAIGLTAGFDPVTGALLTLSVPDPQMPEGEEGNQVGHKEGSIGHLLPGLTVRTEGPNLVIGSVLPGATTVVRLLGMKMDETGFLYPAA